MNGHTPNEEAPLTRREIEVVRFIASGLSCKEAATKMSRSPRTIENHLRAAYRKLGVHNRVELLRAAENEGFIEAPAAGASTDIELKGRALELIQRINDRIVHEPQDGYFGQLALALAEVFGVRWAGMCEVSSEEGVFDINAFASGGRLDDSWMCPAEGSPCGAVVAHGELTVWSGLSERFPDCEAITRPGADSYVGTLLVDRVLGPVGTLWIMHDKPIDPDLLPLQVLRVLAPRTAAELALARALDRQESRPSASCCE